MNIDYNKILSGSYAWVGFVSISKLRSHGNKIVLVKQNLKCFYSSYIDPSDSYLHLIYYLL